MKISKVTYTKVVQIKQYEPVTISMEAILDDGECAHNVTRTLSLLIDAEFRVDQGGAYAEPPMASIPDTPKEEPKKVAKKKAKKKVAKKVEPTYQKYDRTNDKHKQIFIDMMDDIDSKWRENAAKVKGVSVKVEGFEFINDKTLEVADSFRNFVVAELGLK